MSDPILLACMKVKEKDEKNEVLHERPFSAGLHDVEKNEVLERPFSVGRCEVEKSRSYMSDLFCWSVWI